MSGAVHLPLPQPPDEAAAALLEQLRRARSEMAAAGQTARLIEIGRRDLPQGDHHTRTAFHIETAVAEFRCEAWAAVIARLEEQARALGLQS